jgi:hypothetical protein
MDRPQLLNKLEVMLDEAAKNNQWGEIQIVLRYGTPVLIHETRTTKLIEGSPNGRNPRFETR